MVWLYVPAPGITCLKYGPDLLGCIFVELDVTPLDQKLRELEMGYI